MGPSGEWLLDYALHDARLAGFSEAILVVRPEMEALAKRSFPLPVRLAFQDQQLGTAHAVWSARELIDGPFAVINADDFYGRESYFQLAAFLNDFCGPVLFGLIGFPLGETLSDSGPVSRAICQLDQWGYLIGIEEHPGLQKGGYAFPDTVLTSLNSWALHPVFFDFLDKRIAAFIDNKEGVKSELFLPTMIREVMQVRGVHVKVLSTRTQWIGLTHASDLTGVKARLKEWVEEGLYPSPLLLD